MKNKTKNDEAVSNVIIDGDISFAAKKSLGGTDFFILRLLMALVTTLCTTVMTCYFLNSRHYHFSAVFPSLTAAFAVLALAAASSSNRTVRAIGIGSVSAPFFVFIMKYNVVYSGAVGAAYYYFEKGAKPGDVPSDNIMYSYYSELQDTLPPDDCIPVFLMLLGLLVGFMVGVAYLRRLDFPLLFLGTFPFFMLGLFQGYEAPLFTVIFIVISWVCMLAMSIMNHTTNKAGLKNTFAIHRRKKAFYFTSNNLKAKFFSHYLLNMLVIFGAVFAGAFVFNAATDNARPEKFDKWRRDITHKFNSKAEDLSDWFNKFFKNNTSSDNEDRNIGGMNNGTLGRVGKLEFSDDTLLTVTVKNAPTYPIYLRRYIADDYVRFDNLWKQKETKNSSGLPGNGADNMMNYSHKVIDGLGDQELKARLNNTMSIDVDIDEEDLAYIPYFISWNEELGRVSGGDGSVRTRYGAYEYSYFDSSLGAPNWGASALEFGINVSTLRREIGGDNDPFDDDYYEYVMERYTGGENSEAVRDAAESIKLSHGGDFEQTPWDTELAASFVRNYLSAQNGFVYDSSPGTTAQGEDFVDTFLEEKRGFCVYFASAGVLLMRELGFPARYVEGFIATPSEFDLEKKAELSDRSAHAWCEVFIENFGWVPVEFTPSYADSRNPNLDPRKTFTTTTIPPATTTTTTTTTTPAPTETTTVQTSISGSVNTTVTTTTEKSTTTSKSVSDGDKGTGKGGDGDGDSGSGSRKVMSPVIKVILFYIAIMAVIMLILILRHRRRLGIIRRRITAEDRKSAVGYIYSYYLKYLELIDIKEAGNIPDEKQAAKLIDICEERGLGELRHDITTLSELAIKACLSADTVTEEEYQGCFTALDHLRNDIVPERLNLLGKLSARWIGCMY